jgi:hypothetical protein
MSNPIEPVKPEEFRAMAAAINKVDASAKALLTTGLNLDTLVLLLHHKTRVAQRDCRAVLIGLKGIAEQCLTPEYIKEVRLAQK